jgi:hypothetical protein
MKILACVLSVAVLTGCAASRDLERVPGSVQIMPNDCANRTVLINWLTRQAAISKRTLESQQSYDQAQSQIRHRIWTVRYNCQPV